MLISACKLRFAALSLKPHSAQTEMPRQGQAGGDQAVSQLRIFRLACTSGEAVSVSNTRVLSSCQLRSLRAGPTSSGMQAGLRACSAAERLQWQGGLKTA